MDQEMKMLTQKMRVEKLNKLDLYKELMQLNTVIMTQRAFIHDCLQTYRGKPTSGLTESNKIQIKNRILLLNDKSTHLTELRNDMSVLQRMLHANSVF